MANVKGKVLVPFTYKGKEYKTDNEVSMPAEHAARYEKLDFIKLDREAEKKVVAVQEKKSNAGPGK
jgi:hypothetical protein